MRTIIVGAGQVKVSSELQLEIQNCKLCETARLCFAYCCPEHFKKVRRYVVEIERLGLFVELK